MKKRFFTVIACGVVLSLMLSVLCPSTAALSAEPGPWAYNAIRVTDSMHNFVVPPYLTGLAHGQFAAAQYTLSGGTYKAESDGTPGSYFALMQTDTDTVPLVYGTGETYTISFHYQVTGTPGDLGFIAFVDGLGVNGVYIERPLTASGTFNQTFDFNVNQGKYTPQTGELLTLGIYAQNACTLEIRDFTITKSVASPWVNDRIDVTTDIENFEVPPLLPNWTTQVLDAGCYSLADGTYRVDIRQVTTGVQPLLHTDADRVPLLFGPGQRYTVSFDYTLNQGWGLALRGYVSGKDQGAFFERALPGGTGTFCETIDFSSDHEGAWVMPSNGDALFLCLAATNTQGIEIRNFTIHDDSDKEENSMKIYVDANRGSDLNNGTIESPVKSLGRAQTLVRAAADSVQENVTVYIRGGVYTMSEPLVFDGALDSLPSGKTVTYKNYNSETVYVSGGLALSGWTAVGENLVKASVPDGFVTRDLYVNGTSAIRARTGVLSATQFEWPLGSDGLPGSQIRYRDNGALAQTAQAGDVEIVFKYEWNTHRASVASVQREGAYSVLTLASDNHQILKAMPWCPSKAEHIWYLENSMAFLDAPGEWYYNTTEKAIYYRLRDGESLSSLSAYAGLSEQLIITTGEDSLQNTVFEGLTFCNTTWLRPQKLGGYFTRQGAFTISPSDSTAGNDMEQWRRPEAAIRLFQTDGVKFINNTFINLGGGAIDMERAKNVRISGNLFTDCGGSAVVLGGFKPEMYHSPENHSIVTENCEISNNYIHNICKNMQSANGISVGYARNVDILNNTIHDLPYTGISYGWGWGFNDFSRTPVSAGGRIAGNHIYRVVMDIFDGGAIYTLSRRDGLVIEDNFVHNTGLWNGGIYLDNRSAGYTIRHNVVQNCPTNFCLNGYNTTIYENYLDRLTQTVTGGYGGFPVSFLGFKNAAGELSSLPDATDLVTLGLGEWETMGNSYTAPDGDTTMQANAVIATVGVRPPYKERFGLADVAYLSPQNPWVDGRIELTADLEHFVFPPYLTGLAHGQFSPFQYTLNDGVYKAESDGTPGTYFALMQTNKRAVPLVYGAGYQYTISFDYEAIGNPGDFGINAYVDGLGINGVYIERSLAASGTFSETFDFGTAHGKYTPLEGDLITLGIFSQNACTLKISNFVITRA